MADVERHWFRCSLHGEPASKIWSTEEQPQAAFAVTGDADVAEAFAA
ncbi:MAG: hypothetical protein ACREOD_05595 [Candidatus Dormibacteria bacterium]